jgi:ATP/maltotriose-dependent transcriptional regulator MalT
MRELEVLRLMAEGFSNREIAQRLVLAEGTVKTHAKRIYAKLDVKNRLYAIRLAREMHLL